MEFVTIAGLPGGMSARLITGGYMASSGAGELTDEEIPGPHKIFARMVKRLTGTMSSRTAARRAKISHDTIVRMWNGDRPNAWSIVKLAIGFGVDPTPLLHAADYDPDAVEKEIPGLREIRRLQHDRGKELFVDIVGASNSLVIGEAPPDSNRKIARLLEPDAVEFLDAYEGLPDSLRRVAQDHIKSLLKAAKEGYQKRSDIIGKLPEDEDNEEISDDFED